MIIDLSAKSRAQPAVSESESSSSSDSEDIEQAPEVKSPSLVMQISSPFSDAPVLKAKRGSQSFHGALSVAGQSVVIDFPLQRRFLQTTSQLLPSSTPHSRDIAQRMKWWDKWGNSISVTVPTDFRPVVSSIISSDVPALASEPASAATSLTVKNTMMVALSSKLLLESRAFTQAGAARRFRLALDSASRYLLAADEWKAAETTTTVLSSPSKARTVAAAPMSPLKSAGAALALSKAKSKSKTTAPQSKAVASPVASTLQLAVQRVEARDSRRAHAYVSVDPIQDSVTALSDDSEEDADLTDEQHSQNQKGNRRSMHIAPPPSANHMPPVVPPLVIPTLDSVASLSDPTAPSADHGEAVAKASKMSAISESLRELERKATDHRLAVRRQAFVGMIRTY
jgi:hypothetical protein